MGPVWFQIHYPGTCTRPPKLSQSHSDLLFSRQREEQPNAFHRNTCWGISVFHGMTCLTPNNKLSGGGPLSNKTTEAESRRPLE